MALSGRQVQAAIWERLRRARVRMGVRAVARRPVEREIERFPGIWRETYGIRRVGFHGLSVQRATSQVQVQVPRLVVCHLGGG